MDTLQFISKEDQRHGCKTIATIVNGESVEWIFEDVGVILMYLYAHYSINHV